MSLWRDYLSDEFQKKPERKSGRKQAERNRTFKKWESRFEESQNFEVTESMEYKKHAVRDYMGAQRARKEGVQSVFRSVFHKRSFYRWALIFFIGFLCALFGVGIHMVTIFLVTFKNDIVTNYMYSVSTHPLHPDYVEWNVQLINEWAVRSRGSGALPSPCTSRWRSSSRRRPSPSATGSPPQWALASRRPRATSMGLAVCFCLSVRVCLSRSGLSVLCLSFFCHLPLSLL